MPARAAFDDIPVLGSLSLVGAAAKLREVGEDELADALEEAERHAKALDAAPYETPQLDPRPRRDEYPRPFRMDAEGPPFVPRKRWWPFEDKPWQYTTHAFGYLAPTPPGSESLPISQAGNIPADLTLRGSRIKIALGGIRVAAYPGGGTHRVLFRFGAVNQLASGGEKAYFNTTVRVHEGQQAAIIGYPIFVGLNVGPEGVAFECYTVNVKNEEDEAFLSFLESGVCKDGLRLATVAQPAIAPLSQVALGLTKAIAARHRNVPVQEFLMGLDFTQIPMGARLAEGSYIAVQTPEGLHTNWDWREWVYDRNRGQIVRRDDSTQPIPYNYIVFSVSRYHE